MSPTLTIIYQRRNRQVATSRSSRQRIWRVGMGCGFALSVLVVLIILAGALSYANLMRDLPPIEYLSILLNPPNGLLLQPTRIYDRSGQHLLQVFAPSDTSRRYIPYSSQNPQHLPDTLAQATIAMSDPDFWDHPGYLLGGLDNPDYHPTLAQRLVADLLLWNEPASLRRALRERILAAQVTARYGRSMVLEWYLNSANYGHYAFGAEAAAQLYLGKPAAQLNLAESALLAGVGQAPALNPLDAPQAAFQRRQEVIYVMQALHTISDEEVKQAIATPANLQPNPVTPAYPALAFTNLVISQISKIFDRSRLERGGLTILSTLDYDLQTQAVCAVQAQVNRLGGGSEAAAALQGVPCEARQLLPTLLPGVIVPGVSASAILLDPRMGQVLALVGETYAGHESPFLEAYPSGSLLTPFIYLTGFTRGLSPASLVWDIPGQSDVRNLDGEFHGPVRLRLALDNDYLVSADQVQTQMGAENVWRTAKSFGLNLSPSVNLLHDEVQLTLLEAGQAYGVFAAEGVMTGQVLENEPLRPITVLKVTDANNTLWLNWNVPQTQAVVTPQLAYLMNHVLSDETARWPSMGHANPLEVARPAGVKLGQTNGQSTWVVGYTPQRVAVVWMGTQHQNSTISIKHVAGLWHALIQYASRDLPPESWIAPAGVTTREVCDPSGLLPTVYCPNVVSEVFLNGNEPVQADNLYRVYQINRETGLIATIFTPPHLIEERVYIVVPPEANAWAEEADLLTPPEAYDTIQQLPRNPDAHITIPSMFANLRGKVQVSGTAVGDNFKYYRIQVGQGLNPQTWMQISDDVHSPVDEGILVEWDTSDLDGLYAVQLLVVRSDQRMERATIQVTVDNQAPQVNVTFPQDGQKLNYSQNQQVTFLVQASDNLSLVRVDFYVDDLLVGSLAQSPFSLSWPATLGKHTLRVVASDRAGNQTESEENFTIER